MTIGTAGAFPLPMYSLRPTVNLLSPSPSSQYTWPISVLCPSHCAGGPRLAGARIPFWRLRWWLWGSSALDVRYSVALWRPSHPFQSLPEGTPATFEETFGRLRSCSEALQEVCLAPSAGFAYAPKPPQRHAWYLQGALWQARPSYGLHIPFARLAVLGRGSLQSRPGCWDWGHSYDRIHLLCIVDESIMKL